MSNYINPIRETKEDFLGREATEISREDFLSFDFEKVENLGKYVLCWVANPAFSACVVADKKDEVVRFAAEDGRQKKYFVVERSKLTSSVVGGLR